MIAKMKFKDGFMVPLHSHENEQITEVISGTMRFWFGANKEEVMDLQAGESVIIPGNVPHAALMIGDVEEILNRKQVGVSMRLDQDSFDDVAKTASELIESSTIKQRARSVAEEIFNVESGAEKYYSIYEKLCHDRIASYPGS